MSKPDIAIAEIDRVMAAGAIARFKAESAKSASIATMSAIEAKTCAAIKAARRRPVKERLGPSPGLRHESPQFCANCAIVMVGRARPLEHA